MRLSDWLNPPDESALALARLQARLEQQAAEFARYGIDMPSEAQIERIRRDGWQAHEKARNECEKLRLEAWHMRHIPKKDSPAPVPEAGKLKPDKILNGSQAKTAYCLRQNAEAMIKEGGEKACGFLTLTVGDLVKCAEFGCDGCKKGEHFRQVFDADEANRRFNNLNRHFLKTIFEKAIVVSERCKNGAIHFHLLGILNGRPDIKSRFNFSEVEKRNYRSVSRHLKSMWELLRDTLPEYKFGRAELMPIRKTGEAVSCYISKYIEKNICNRREEDKRKKLVRYLGWQKLQDEPRYPKFGEMIGGQLKPNEIKWASAKACAWRVKAMEMGKLLHIESPDDAKEALGPRWAHDLTRVWMSLFGDEESDYMVLDDGTGEMRYKRPEFNWKFREKELVRAELVNISGAWMKKKDLPSKIAEAHREMLGESTEHNSDEVLN